MMQHIANVADHIYLALGATDFRKQQNGLASLVALKFKIDPHSGASVFLFCNKRHNTSLYKTAKNAIFKSNMLCGDFGMMKKWGNSKVLVVDFLNIV